MLEGIEKIRRDLRGKETAYLLVPNFLKQLDAIEREVEEGYIELPKDKNGEQVSIGDTVYDHEEGYDFRVDGFMLWGNTTEWWAFQDQAVQQKLKNCSIVKPPTVEDVLNELCTKAFHSRYPDAHVLYKDVIAEYSQKLQLREE